MQEYKFLVEEWNANAPLVGAESELWIRHPTAVSVTKVIAISPALTALA